MILQVLHPSPGRLVLLLGLGQRPLSSGGLYQRDRSVGWFDLAGGVGWLVVLDRPWAMFGWWDRCWTKNRGSLPPKWMVKIMETPIKMDDLGGTIIFGNTQIFHDEIFHPLKMWDCICLLGTCVENHRPWNPLGFLCLLMIFFGWGSHGIENHHLGGFFLGHFFPSIEQANPNKWLTG